MDIRNLLIECGIIKCAILVYIDDFILAAVFSLVLKPQQEVFEKVMEWLGFLLNPEKRSEICLKFNTIGFEIDTVNLQVLIILSKFKKRRDLLSNIRFAKSCTWSEF